MDKDYLRLEAQRLSSDETLKLALSNMRKLALESLATADPFDAQAILKHQARIFACDEFISELGMMINSSQERKPFTVV